MTHASVFSGIGGPEVAAAMLGWKNLFHCEINPFGRTVLEYWFPESESYEDIIKTDFRKWRGQVDVLTGGFPCQPFSYAGKRGGREDERYLWPQMCRVIDEVRPTWVVGENVAGITTMVEGGVLVDLGEEASLFDEGDGVHRYEYKQPFTIERICTDLEHIGYSVQPVLIPAAAVGAPHRRDRVFICAHSDSGDSRTKSLRQEREDPVHGLFASSNADSRRGGEIPTEIHAGISDGPVSFGDGRKRNAADSDGNGFQESEQPGRREDCEEERKRMDDRTVRPCGDEVITDAFCKRLSAAVQSGLYGAEKWDGQGRPIIEFTNDAWIKGSWWNNFPTVSPVHARNDGLSVPMDRASIPFNKWRTEALKAYGNAIVCQVAYRIFQAIEEVENGTMEINTWL